MNHPYSKYENSEEWILYTKIIKDLIENNDIELLTPIEYVVGYICKEFQIKHPSKDMYEWILNAYYRKEKEDVLYRTIFILN